MEEGLVDKIKSASHAVKMLVPGKRAAHEKQLRDKQVTHDMKHMDDDTFFRKYPELNHDEHEYSPNNFVDPKKHWPTPDGKRPKSDQEAAAMRNATKKQHAPDVWDKLAASKKRLPRAIEMFEFDKTQFAKDTIARIDRMVSEKAQALRDEVAANLFRSKSVTENVDEDETAELDTPIVVEGIYDGEEYVLQFANMQLYEEWSDTDEAQDFDVTSIKEANSIQEEVDDSFLDESGEISELSDAKKTAYHKAASKDAALLQKAQKHAPKSKRHHYDRPIKNRMDGLKRALSFDDRFKKEETEVNELSKSTLGSYIKKASKSTSDLSLAKQWGKYDDEKSVVDKADARLQKRNRGVDKAVKRLTKEEEEVSELSKKTLGNYIKKANRDSSHAAVDADDAYSRDDIKGHQKNLDRAKRRYTGIAKATDKLTKEETEVNELSKEKLGKYIDQARKSIQNRASKLDWSKLLKRHSGIMTAGDKLTK